MKTIQELKLEAEVAEMLTDITDLQDELVNGMSNGDYQGILEAKAMQIISKVKEVIK